MKCQKKFRVKYIGGVYMLRVVTFITSFHIYFVALDSKLNGIDVSLSTYFSFLF